MEKKKKIICKCVKTFVSVDLNVWIRGICEMLTQKRKIYFPVEERQREGEGKIKKIKTL